MFRLQPITTRQGRVIVRWEVSHVEDTSFEARWARVRFPEDCFASESEAEAEASRRTGEEVQGRINLLNFPAYK